jgi:hypothetical protein
MASKRQSKGSAAVASEPDYTLPENAPRWMKIAFEGARRIRESGVTLPTDTAENHDAYAHGRKNARTHLR